MPVARFRLLTPPMSSTESETVSFPGGSAGEPDDDESALLQLLVDVPGHPSVVGTGPGHRAVRVVGTDTPVDDHFDLFDAGEAGHEVLVEIRPVLGDDDEDPHAGSLPRRVGAGRDFSSAVCWRV